MKKFWKSLHDVVFLNSQLNNPESRKQARLIQAYQNCFLDETGNLSCDGELVLRNLIEKGFVKTSTAMLTDTRTIDPNATLIAEGKRSIVLEIIEMIQFDLLKTIQLKEIDNE